MDLNSAVPMESSVSKIPDIQIDRVLSAKSRNAFPSITSLQNMKKASSYRTHSTPRSSLSSRHVSRSAEPKSRRKLPELDHDDGLDDMETNDDEIDCAKSQHSISNIQDLKEEDFDFDSEEPVKNGKGDMQSQITYAKACEILKHSPVTAFFNGLTSSEILMRHHVLGPRRIKACAISLVNNTSVKKLHLEDNDVGPEGAIFLAEMLEENTSINDLEISFNGIGREGLKSLADVIKHSDIVTNLNLSGNGFEDMDARYIVEILEENPVIRELKVANNRFGEQGASMIAEVLGHNDTLEVLDLSWNHVRRKGAVAICRSLKCNSSLVDVNLSWNGLAVEGCEALAEALSENTSLLTLNINCNRIGMEALGDLLKGIKSNTTLKALHLSENPLTTDGAVALLKAIDETPDTGLTLLDISSQSVGIRFGQLLEKIQSQRQIEVKYGRMIEMDIPEDSVEKAFDEEDPMMVLMEFMKIKNLRLIDLFMSLDADKSQSLTREEFKQGLMSVNIPMSSEALDRLLDKLDKDKDGEVDFGELKIGQQLHRTKSMKLKQKQKGMNMEKTDLGRINAKMRSLMAIRKTTTKPKLNSLASETLKQMQKRDLDGEQEIASGQESLMDIKIDES